MLNNSADPKGVTMLADSTPVECARARETVKRAGANSLGGALSDAADYGYCASHSRYFWVCGCTP